MESTGAVKQQIIGLIHAIAYLRGNFSCYTSVLLLHSMRGLWFVKDQGNYFKTILVNVTDATAEWQLYWQRWHY